MKKIRICLIGGGNITNTRHIPALLKNRDVEVIGIIGHNQRHIERTIENCPTIKYSTCINSQENSIPKYNEIIWFRDEIDAVVIGTPPTQHYPCTYAALVCNKHVLVEKPMMETVEQCNEVLALAKQNCLILNVVHSFQFSNGMLKLAQLVAEGRLGEIQSIVEMQFTNRNRRLPPWYNTLPLGLFFDEAAHFFYSAIRFGGKLAIQNVSVQPSKLPGNTPCHLSVQATSGQIPVQMYMNFDSPVCEWKLCLMGSEKMAVYDFFKDILVVIDNDGLHLARNVLKASLQETSQYWQGFFLNGVRMLTKRLYYGMDLVMCNFSDAVLTGKENPLMSSTLGQEVVIAMNEVIALATRK